MGNEFFIGIFFFPVLAGILVLLYLASFSVEQAETHPGTLGLGRRRIAAGLLGAIVATLILTTISEFSSAYSRGLEHNAVNWAASMFIIVTPFVIAGIVILGFPFFSFLRRYRLQSVLGCCLIALFISGVFAVLALPFPDNLWCEANPVQCVTRRLSFAFTLSGLCALGFGIFARLPIFRSANQ
jgi:hypothetical protein